ncbi:CocE/NonD family hydrolase [Pseudonocardia spirodelae]|uniref:CocE/NonD family hydrolase n=1 Tax=Pseudonocardia spirodelae TaxID=3133431 RepID=A0ABU8T031_9PSEU
MTPPGDPVTVRAGDGTPLAATLVRPAARRWPAVLIRTPSGREHLLPEARGWAAHGFGCLVVDVRGRGGSAGAVVPYAHETGDGLAALAALRAVDGCDGRVVLAGASYGAHCAVVTAIAAPDVSGVLVAVPALGPGETAREPGGAARLACRIGWWGEHGEGARPAPPSALAALPVTAALGTSPPGWPQLWDAPADTPQLWAGVARATAPLLAVGGTADPFAARTAQLARCWGGPSRLLLGPWGHELDARDPGAVLGGRRIGAVYAAWARAAAQGRARGSGALVAAGTSGRWVRPGVRAVVVDAGPGGAFLADPQQPVCSRAPHAPRPAPAPATPPDRVVARTPPLPAGTLAGPLRARLDVSTAAPDADWVVRIGLRGHDLVTAVRRERRAGRGEVVVTTAPVGAELHDGDRLDVEIAGHHWPAHARNPHTGADPAHATDLRPDRRTVHAVRLELPHVPPGRDEVAAAAVPEEICP